MRTSKIPTPGAVANRRLLVYILAAAAFVSFLFLGLGSHSGGAIGYASVPIHRVSVAPETLKGGAIMPKLGNETLKAELGRASWKLLHTMMARFPDKPSEDEQTALLSYVHLFARLYPCGECAGHFRQILDKFPPQVRSRSTAAVWACHVHNEVNHSLAKDTFDCSKIGDFYDCGCADDDKDGDKPNGGDAAAKKDPEDSGELKLERDRQMAGG